MDSLPDFLAEVVLGIVMLCWLVFAGAFLFRKKPPSGTEKKRENAATYGIALEGIGYALVWTFRRPTFTSIMPLPLLLDLAIALVTVGIAVASVWLVLSAVRTLGKQWAFAARLVEGHTLITEGVYSIVRNPIYTGMFGLMIATGLAISYWWTLPPAIVVFWIGTMLRVRSEEKLLREAFGKEFEEYARRVPALLPLWAQHGRDNNDIAS
jgi:protein-S-isoprenylcysteine O-methyltransferase Ste14